MRKLFDIFRGWEIKFALTFVSLVVTLLLWGIDHFREHNPRLKMEVISRANVIDVREKLSDLDIIYKGASLHSNQQTLAVVTVKVVNDGGTAIPISAYDKNAPVGMKISERVPPRPVETELDKKISAKINEATKGLLAVDGDTLPFSLNAEPTITRADIIAGSRTYLSDNRLTYNTNIATFEPVILQVGDWFEVKLLIQHGEGKDFDLKPTGEIAGVKTIQFIGPNEKELPPSLWEQTFRGGVWVQLLRLLSYLLASLLLIFLIALPSVAISSYIKKRRRKIQLAHYRKLAIPVSMPEYNWVLEAYIGYGPSVIRTINKVVQKPQESLKTMMGYYFSSGATGTKTFEVLEKMRDSGALAGDIVNPKFKQYMELFSSYFKKELADDADSSIVINAEVAVP